MPLRRGGETLGTLEVVTKDDRSFGPEDQDVMAAFADLTAVAIDHSRLFNETRHHLAELQAANRRLEELDRLRQDYLRNVSHEFPLQRRASSYHRACDTASVAGG